VNAEALVLTRALTLERRDIALPAVSDDTALLRIEACGLCGTDHKQFSGNIPADFAFIPGHEIVGVIERIGEKASAQWGVTTGQRVAVEVFRSCRECAQCRRGEYKRCVRKGMTTMFGFVSVDRG
jgi:alcohol dehydrogenase